MTTLWRLLRDQRPLWPGVLLLMGLAAVLPPLAVATPLIERHVIDGVILAQQPAALLPAVALYGAVWLLHTATSIGAATLSAYLGERVQQGLRQRLLAHCAALAVPFSRMGHSGQTMALFTSDVPAISGFPATLAFTAVGGLVGVAVAAAAMVTLNWQLALAAALAPPAVAAAAAVLTRPLRPAARRAQEKAAELSERLQETLAGLREVVAFGQEAAAGRRFATTLGDLLRLRMRLAFLDTGMRTGQSVFILAVTVVLVGYGGYLVMQGVTTLGTLVAMQALFGLVLQPVTQLAGIAREAQKAAGATERVYGFLDVAPQVTERETARSPLPGPQRVVFDRVGFDYEPGRPVLEGISFAAQPGETVALVGPSGAGKTTLMSLLPRFYDPTAGRILLGGDDLRDLSLRELRARIGFVFQDTFLFSGTIRENIAFGAQAASEAAIVAALAAANAGEFVASLPRGLDTRTGERGAFLSEGQKQRLSLARALVRDPAILILDEPTSALDARAESVVQAALERATRGRTTFVVAHRLATVQRADRIVVLDGGRIVQQGTHGELLDQDGLYRDFCLLQLAPARGAAAVVAPRDDRAGGDDPHGAVPAMALGSNA